MPEKIYHTYEEWKLIGRPVRKGEKSHNRNTQGQASFELSQTIDIIDRECVVDRHHDASEGDYSDMF